MAERAPSGQTRLAHLAGDGALTVRPTPHPGSSGRTRAHLIAGAFGPLGGDTLRLEIEVGPDADLEVAAVAATVAQRSRDGRPSRMDVCVSLGERASLRLTLPPTVVSCGACHTVSGVFDIAPTSRLLLREETIRGRSNETGGDAYLITRLEVGGRVVLHQELDLCGPVGDPWHPRAVGTLLVIGTPGFVGPTPEPDVNAAWLELPRGAGYQFTAIDNDPLALSQLLDAQLPR